MIKHIISIFQPILPCHCFAVIILFYFDIFSVYFMKALNAHDGQNARMKFRSQALTNTFDIYFISIKPYFKISASIIISRKLYRAPPRTIAFFDLLYLFRAIPFIFIWYLFIIAFLSYHFENRAGFTIRTPRATIPLSLRHISGILLSRLIFIIVLLWITILLY